MTLDRNIIEKKLEQLVGYVKEMEPLVQGAPDSIARDTLHLRGIERLFQLCVDAMLDINVHLIREEGLGAPDDLYSTFKLLGERGVLEKVFAEKIAPIVGARNMLVHQYEKIDVQMFLNNLQRNFSDFGKYQRDIMAYMESRMGGEV